MEVFKKIFNKPFVKTIQAAGGELFVVGGSVRDYFLKKEPKDIDMIVRLLPYENVVNILSSYGKVDVVGESFGVIKFKEFETNEEIELSLPRKDEKLLGEKGHKSICAQSDPLLSIPMDLGRRDFCFNAMALDSKLNLIDPYSGALDIKSGLVHPVFPETFIDDPLRMLRALQFAARFEFTLTDECFKLIQNNNSLILDISSERILMEFQKVIDKKGNLLKFASLLNATGISQILLGCEINELAIASFKCDIKTLSEFLFVATKDTGLTGLNFLFTKILKIDLKTSKELKALEVLHFSVSKQISKFKLTEIFYNTLQIAPWFLNSSLFDIKDTIIKKQFLQGVYPKNIKELPLSGEDLISLGLKGKDIGEMQREVLNAILNDEIKNNTIECFRFVKSKLK